MAGQGPCDDYYGNVAPVPTLASQEPGGGATLPLAILPSCRAAQPRLSAKFDCWEMDGMQRTLSPLLQLPCPAPRAVFITLIIVKQMFVEKTQDCICDSVHVLFMQNIRTLSTDS